MKLTYLPEEDPLVSGATQEPFFIVKVERTGVKLVRQAKTRHPDRIFKINPSATSEFNTFYLTNG